MRKIICAPEPLIPRQLEEGTKYISIYSNSRRENVGYFGSTLVKDIQRAGLRPSEEAWDFTTIALSVASADNSLTRGNSADGWTRQIDITIQSMQSCNLEPCKTESRKNIKVSNRRFLAPYLQRDRCKTSWSKKKKAV